MEVTLFNKSIPFTPQIKKTRPFQMAEVEFLDERYQAFLQIFSH